ncbi:MAG: hypothetical protein SOY60_06910 [Fusobacterium gastrosuis]|uniref:hypothetical protein n=1 Tax=Fusobacterium gastrosuis TaxID=1755100 RepID=UPI002A8A24E7|nr:hypothetical protein [Fusobacterium gastrosuis]
MITIERIRDNYKKYINSDLYKNIDNYRKLSDGKSSEVFENDVAKRVKMEYMGVLNDINEYQVLNFDVQKNKISTSKGGNIKDLVCSYGILQAITRLYAEYGTSKELILNTDLEIDVDVDTLLAKMMIIQSWAGKCLLKGVINEDKYSFYTITPKDYFSIDNLYNPTEKDAYIVYSFLKNEKQNDVSIMLCEIYEENSVEYKAFKYQAGKIEVEVYYPLDLSINGMLLNGLGYKDPNAIGWAVQEVQNIFGKSDYNDDLLKLVREVIVGDTLTSQAFQKVANPLIQVPDSLIEIDNKGRATVRLDERVITVRATDREIKQIQLETKTAEWKEHRKTLVDEIYKQTGVNDLAFGVSVDGAIASGEAKRRSLERIISTVSGKRHKCIKVIKKMLEWAIKRTSKKDIKIDITAQDILTLSLSEKINIVVSALQNDLMSLETSIEFIGLQNNDISEEIQRIKQNMNYKTKELNILQQLENIARDERLQKEVENITEELITELIGG